MSALVELTQPGPFEARTIEMGTYLGVRNDGELVAMAGQRMRLEGYTEISAVCTHPEHQGHGLAGLLVERLVDEIHGRDEVPFLHAASHNATAISRYRSLGFTNTTRGRGRRGHARGCVLSGHERVPLARFGNGTHPRPTARSRSG